MKKIKRIFISYSHLDKDFHDQFRKHLIPMELTEQIIVWSDVELVLGDEITPKILRKLGDSEIVVFLISPDFFASKFIMNQEVKKTLANEGKKKIISIILRHCDWKDMPLAKYLLAPKDGKPVIDFTNREEVWVEVINDLKKSIKEIEEESKGSSVDISYDLKKEFLNELSSTEVKFYHKNKDDVTLEDIFIYPDLKVMKEEFNDLEKTISSEKIKDESGEENKILIVGEEQSGKTTLGKMMIRQYLVAGYLPILLNGSEISETDVDKYLSRAIKKQYENLNLSDYLKSEKKKVIFIDDFYLTSLNRKHQKKFLENIEIKIGLIVVFGDKIQQYNEKEYLVFSSYALYEILDFGHVKRSEMIEKWNSIGTAETIDEKKLEELTDISTRHINLLLRGNIVPRRPIYILTILQTLDATKVGEYSKTSYGYCYQSMILLALSKQKIHHQEYEMYFNYLCELAFFMFEKNVTGLTQEEIKSFQTNYSKDYVIESHEKIINVLLNAKLLVNKNDKYSFCYKYIFYFYVAKYLADKIDGVKCKGILENLCENIHSEKNANILIFLIHHTKERKIIDEILVNTMCVFDGMPEETLDLKGLEFLRGLFAAIPKLIMEQRNTEIVRKEHLKEQDKFEVENKKEEKEDEDDFVGDDQKIFRDIVRSARAVEIIGQILRNYHGSLKKEDLKDLSTQAIKVGLRYLRFYLKALEFSKEQFLEILQSIIKEKSKLNDEDVAKEAKKVFLTICYQMSHAVLWKIGNSLGEDKLLQINEEIRQENGNSNAVRLIEIIVKLEYSKNIPKKEIRELSDELSNTNPFTFRILQQILMQHSYLHSIERAERQWISDVLKIPLRTQILIDEQKTQKLD